MRQRQYYQYDPNGYFCGKQFSYDGLMPGSATWMRPYITVPEGKINHWIDLGDSKGYWELVDNELGLPIIPAYP